jgi:hypothetical protein
MFFSFSLLLFWSDWCMQRNNIIDRLIIGRLFNYGIGIHLLQAEDPDSLPGKTEINPKDNHISFQVRLVYEIWIISLQILQHIPFTFMIPSA